MNDGIYVVPALFTKKSYILDRRENSFLSANKSATMVNSSSSLRIFHFILFVIYEEAIFLTNSFGQLGVVVFINRCIVWWIFGGTNTIAALNSNL